MPHTPAWVYQLKLYAASIVPAVAFPFTGLNRARRRNRSSELTGKTLSVRVIGKAGFTQPGLGSGKRWHL